MIGSEIKFCNMISNKDIALKNKAVVDQEFEKRTKMKLYSEILKEMLDKNINSEQENL